MYTYKWGKKDSDIFNDAFSLRWKVFVEEQKFHDEADDYDQKAEHLVIYDADKPIGTGRTIDLENGSLKIGRVCILKEYRGKGIGRLIMEEIERSAKEKGYSNLILGAQCRVSEFYNAVGYKEVGEIYLDEHCEHIDMIKEI